MDGFMYPNEVELQWSVLIVLYPFITGLVAGAFILASLERVFRVEEVKPTYRLALLTALAFLIVAPLPLQLHLGHPERSLEMYLTPHRCSAMAMFGFVYLWYLMAVLLLEIWLDYRRDIVMLAQSSTGWRKPLYRLLTLGSYNITPGALRVDDIVGWTVTLIGIPSAFLLHGYVGFIFGSIKANPWWSTPLMPVVFLVLRHGLRHRSRSAHVHAHFVPAQDPHRHALPGYRCQISALYLHYRLHSRNGRPIHRIYESDESFRSLDFMVHTRLFFSQIVLQIFLGTLLPILLLASTQLFKLSESIRKRLFAFASILTMIGIFAMRWNVVIGGQLFSKSFLGYTTYKVDFVTREGLLPAAFLLVLPFAILFVLVKILPPWHVETSAPIPSESGD